jgi:hypothetical protein
MKEFRGVFPKLPCIGYFVSCLIYFSKGKAWTGSTLPGTESTGPVYGSIGFIKWWSLIIGSVAQIKSVKGYTLVLISCVGSQMNGHELIRCGGGALAVAGWAHSGVPWPLTGDGGHGGYGSPFLQGFFLRLRNDMGAIPSGRWGRSSLWLGRHRGAPPVNLRLQDWDGKLAGVHLSLLCQFNSSNWRWKSSSMATYGSLCSSTCGWKSEHNRPVSIGVLVPTHSGLSFLTILSRSQLQIAADKEESKRG